MLSRHSPVLERGFTLVEALIALAVGALIIAGLSGVISTSLQAEAATQERNELVRQARFAMDRMLRAVSNTRLLLLPLTDNPATNWPENIREETVPPSAPIGSSTKATAVLAVTLPLYSDMDGDGFPDADDDRDGWIDEDIRPDQLYDQAPGIYLIDDDGDGQVDEGFNRDDDEDGVLDEDPINGVDDDGDGSVDEDASGEMNGDGCPGVCAVDDDGDNQVDEGFNDDDDEDGQRNEDWYNPVVFYLNNGTLKERTPVPWDISGGGLVGGQDFITSDIAEHVIRFRVERLPLGGNRTQLVDITLELSGASGEPVVLTSRVRVGGGV